jgi:hypothetical protein
VAKLLLEQGAELESKDADGQTPLSFYSEIGAGKVYMIVTIGECIDRCPW